ncbi:DUF1847 domain-containing protein [Lachnospiraceae bacterium NSJ-143]|nr:DUF1847 domain-containing protein [Lachnospiraceae bacterium NSJ-143]
MEKEDLSCIDCYKVTCDSQDFPYPDFCQTVKYDGIVEEAVKLLKDDAENSRLAMAAAQVEGNFYCKLTRVEETVKFAEKIGAKKLGIATCAGTIREARIFAKILRKNGFEVIGEACKVGNRDKTEIGIDDKDKIHPDCYEPMCNPILQAKILNEEKTDLNVMMGLCVGHDALFIKYSDAPVTVLFTKDRVMGHNAVMPLYLTESYYRKLL